MQQTISLRQVRDDDVPDIHAIYEESVMNGVATYELVPPGIGEMAARIEVVTASRYPWLVAECDGKVAGYAYASAFRTRAAYRFLVEDSIYIAPNMRGRGVGRLLLDRLIEDCRQLGFRQMVAVIGGAHPASIGLHRAADFVSTGRMTGTGYKFGRWLDTEIMQLALGEGTHTLPDDDAYPGTLYHG